jgi:hypothetical protein
MDVINANSGAIIITGSTDLKITVPEGVSWVRHIFLELTKNLHPYGQESYIENYFRSFGINYQKDDIGNYFVVVGESRTMFTSHLDNHTRELKKVTHVFIDNYRKVETNGKTPLGSDDKAGVTIMLNMILHKVPGTYYFFVGEEPVLTYGCKGSKDIYWKNKGFFTKFERCIAFDRRGYGSVISKQRGRTCCSKEFVAALIAEFAANGMEYKDDPGGVYTDSAVFMETIPEVTNLSCGGFREHTVKEMQNLAYLERVANASINIKWETLPVKRDPKEKNDWWHKPKKTEDKPLKRIYGDNPPKTKKEIRKISKREGMPMATKKPQKKGSLFSFDAFFRNDAFDVYEKTKDYMGFMGYDLRNFDKNVYGNVICRFYNHKIKNLIEISFVGNRLYIKHGKETFEGITIKDFERIFDIGFAGKFYKYADLFIQDLKDYSKDTGYKRINFYVVNNILKTYGSEFDIKGLIKEYDKLFDEDDFKILRGIQMIEL